MSCKLLLDDVWAQRWRPFFSPPFRRDGLSGEARYVLEQILSLLLYLQEGERICFQMRLRECRWGRLFVFPGDTDCYQPLWFFRPGGVARGPSVSDRNPIKHHLQMIVSPQHGHQVTDVQSLIRQRRPFDYCYMFYPGGCHIYGVLWKQCWRLRLMQTSGPHRRMFGCLVWGSTNPSGRNCHAGAWNFPDP